MLDTVDNEKTARVIELYPQYQGTGSWYRKLYYTGNTYPYSFSEYSGDFTTADYQKLTLHNIRSITKLPVTKTISTPNNFNINIVNLDTLDYLKNETVNAGTLPAVFTENFTNFDRSNSRLSKIIELPYCPVPVVQSGDIFKFTSCIFVPGYNILKIDAASVLNLIAQDTRINDLLYLTISKPTAKDSPNQSLESKLYSSEFYDFAYYYDTDKMPIRLEDFTSNSQSSAIGITYAQTLSLNSDKQFHFYPLYGSYNQIQPFETYLNCSRNTERLVLNSSYADYLKNGYNYDQWAQKQAQKQAATNAVISAISAGVSFIPGVGTAISNTAKTARAIGNYQTDKLISNVKLAQAERYERENPDQPPIADSLAEDYQGYLKTQLSEIGNSALKSVSGVGNLVINNGVNAINNTISAARSIERQKRRFTNAIASKSASPVSASGSTPTDLFDNYTDNKLIRFEFRPRDYEITNLWQKFRLTGYATAVNGIPDFNSRIYSNFVQCNAVFNNESTEIYKIYLDDIKQRFAAGVTVKHNYNGVYDLKDIYENYETFVLN